jgi:lipopolysaccharide export system permease protein
MKKILFRKLLRDYISFFLIALFSSSIIIWVFQAVNYLDIMIEDGRDYIVYINYSLLNFPKIISRLFPFVLFFSLYYVTTKYENNNELIIFWNFGVHKIELTNFIIKISLVLMIMQILLSSIIVPKTQDAARNFLRTSSVNFFENFIKPQKFNDTIRGVTIYSESKDQDGNLNNLYLKKENEDGFQITYAKKGVFKEFNKIPVLVLYDGETIKGGISGITNFSFTKSDFALNKLKTNTTTYIKTQELSSLKLYKCVSSIHLSIQKKPDEKIENCSLNNLKNIYKEIYKRLVIPFYIPLLALITFLLILSSKENSNYYKLKIFTFLFGLFFIIFSETTVRLISENLLSNSLIISMPYLSFLILYLFLFKKLNFKSFAL